MIEKRHLRLNSLILDLDNMISRRRAYLNNYGIFKDELKTLRNIKKEIKLLNENELNIILKQSPNSIILRTGIIHLVLGVLIVVIIGKIIEAKVSGLGYLIIILYVFFSFRFEIIKADELYIMQKFIREIKKHIDPDFRKKCNG